MSKDDHEEDDLDDLDDLLDDFANVLLDEEPGAAKVSLTTATINTTQEEKPASVPASALDTEPQQPIKYNKSQASEDDDPSVPELDDEFAEKLKLGMNYLLSEMDGQKNNEGTEALESLMAELSGATGGAASKKSASASGSESVGFQDTISQTMDRLKESKGELDDQADQPDTEDAFLSKIMKELEGASGIGGGLDGILGEMLRELSSKEILYEPIKEMHNKYPAWLEQNKDKVTEEELARYQNQQRIVDEITIRFEAPGYSDSNPEDHKYIADRMEEMQKSGAPPTELMGELAGGALPGFDGMSGGLDGLGSAAGMPSEKDLDNCAVQ